MQSNSSSLRAKRQRTLSRFRPYQSGRHELLSPPCLTRSKVMTRDTSSSTTEDQSFHTAMDQLLSTKSGHGQPLSEDDAIKSISDAPSFSPSRLTRQNAVILDALGAANCSSSYGPAEPGASQSISLCSYPDSVPCPSLNPQIPPGLKESIHKAIRYHVKKYAAQLEASLSNQIEVGLSEAIDFTLNIIERPLAETHPLDSRTTMSAAVYSDSPSKAMPGAWKQSQSPL